MSKPSRNTTMVLSVLQAVVGKEHYFVDALWSRMLVLLKMSECGICLAAHDLGLSHER